MKKTIFVIATAMSLLSCEKESVQTYNAAIKAPLTIQFDNIAGGSNLQLQTGTYTNASNEQFQVSMLKYFISNISLTTVGGVKYTVPQDSSYFIIDESDPSSLTPSIMIPEGEYSKLDFVLGVDSLRNTKDISQRTGVLDPAGKSAGMYWSWNSGYIFFKMEGTSPASTLTGNKFQYHIGLFGGYATPTLNNLKNISIDLNARGTAKVKSGHLSNLHVFTDILKMFNGSSNISIATNPMVMASPFSANIANNYAGMFQHDHTENE